MTSDLSVACWKLAETSGSYSGHVEVIIVVVGDNFKEISNTRLLTMSYTTILKK